MHVRRISVGLLIIVLFPAAASARHRPVVVPPGNSGANQYVEVLPTAGGGRPSGTIHSGGSGGGSGGLSPGTQQALARGGSDGLGAAALAHATAPTGQAARSGSGRHHGASNGSGANTSNSARSTGSVSPITTLVRAMTGSTHGGIGLLLPVILVVLALGGGALALRRRRAV